MQEQLTIVILLWPLAFIQHNTCRNFSHFFLYQLSQFLYFHFSGGFLLDLPPLVSISLNFLFSSFFILCHFLVSAISFHISF